MEVATITHDNQTLSSLTVTRFELVFLQCNSQFLLCFIFSFSCGATTIEIKQQQQKTIQTKSHYAVFVYIYPLTKEKKNDAN